MTEMLLAEFPVLRKDEQMMKAHTQIIDFLETFVDGAVDMIKKNQALLKEILEAAKISENYFDQFLKDRVVDVSVLGDTVFDE
ncbi:hypothetical protein EON65_36635 [archaeon]|nr:MAG: hypothetical protein EON65_36635 [archaeon]